VEIGVEKNQALVVRAQYAGGEPMSYAKVRIINPEGRTHQVGNADARGRFAWLPDKDGRWRAVVEDGMGHRAELALVWQEGGEVKPGRPAGAAPLGQPLWARVVWGLALIWFLGGAVFWLKGRKRRARPE
jgi:nickel transport protein